MRTSRLQTFEKSHYYIQSLHRRDEPQISGNYSAHKVDFDRTCTEFQAMCNHHFGRINFTEVRMEHLGDTAEHVDAVSLCAGPRSREFKMSEIYKFLAEYVSKAVQMETAAPIVYSNKKDSIVCFCFDYRRLSALTKQGSFHIPGMNKFFQSIHEPAVFTNI